MNKEWEVHSLDHSDTRYGIGRTAITEDGKFQFERYHKTFSTFESATRHAKKLNEVTA
jgi:hypothetical protein